MDRTPTLSLTLPSFGPMFAHDDWRGFLEIARRADELGVDRLLVAEHIVMADDYSSYPFGSFPFPPDAPWLEPLTALSAVCSVTANARLSTKILIAPLRPAPVLAKMLATMDVLSGGRIEIGVGPGWQRAEYDAAGVEWARRGQLLTDTIAACQALWDASPCTFSSPSFSFDGIWCEPKPIQPHGIPVWFAGALHPRNLDRITRLGVGWIPPAFGDPAQLAEGVATLRAAWSEAGRAPDELQIQGDLEPVLDADGRPNIAATMETARAWIDAGATTVNVVLLMFAHRKERALAVLPDIVDGWRGALDA